MPKRVDMQSIQQRLIAVTEAMAEDLREYADSAREAGNVIEVTENLLVEFDFLSEQLRESGFKDA